MTSAQAGKLTTTMAQARVTEFYATKKRNGDAQPSKRRKLQVISDVSETIQNEPVATRAARSSARTKGISAPVSSEPENVLFTLSSSDKGNKLAPTKTPKQRSRRIKQIKGQQSIVSALGSRPTSPNEISSGEEVTSAWDEHDGPLTPSKKTKQDNDNPTEEKTKGTRKRTRKQNVMTPQKEENQKEEAIKAPRSRKKLQLRANVIASSESENSENEVIGWFFFLIDIPGK